MAMTVNTNLSSLNAQRNMSTSQASLSRSMERLSSGLRVNGAKDDAAGLAIAERMNKDVRAMAVAMRNANDGISLAQTGDSALGKITDSLQRMRELATQSANETYSASDRANMGAEYKELGAEITRVLQNTTFNGNQLLGASADGNSVVDTGMDFQVGAGGTLVGASERITVAMSDLNDPATKLNTALAAAAGNTGINDATTAQGTMDTLADAINEVTTARGNFGAVQNRFEQVISNLQSSSENTSAARGRIMDADFASESSNMSRANILQQASMAMVAQANQAPQQVMKLLQ